MSFLKQEPPKPTLALRNLGPIRLSIPMARATSPTSASVFSHRAEMLLIEEILWARNALATSFDSSELQTLPVRILSPGTQWAEMSTISCRACSPSGVSLDPTSTRSGWSRSATAVPSARNSGLEITSNRFPLALRICSIVWAVLTGRVLFSTTILGESDTRRICRATFSQHCRSAALPALRPAPSPRR